MFYLCTLIAKILFTYAVASYNSSPPPPRIILLFVSILIFSSKLHYFTDASSSNEAVHLQQRLRSLSSELLTLKNRLQVQGENGSAPCAEQPNPPGAGAPLHTSHTTTNNVINAINTCHNQSSNVLPPTLPKNQIPIPPHLPNTVPHISESIDLTLYTIASYL